MNKKKLISVVVPIYNVEEYLEECIYSIVRQSYNNIEIILVDDGSTDKSGILCEKLSEEDERIKVLHKENEGLSSARNVGVSNALGEFIVFVDSDDIIHPQIVEILYEEMIKNNADLSICSYKRIHDSKEIEVKKITQEYEIKILSGVECIKNMYSHICVDMVVAWNKLYKKEYLINNFYPIGRIHEDEFITYKILLPLKKCVYIEYPLYYYRQRETSIMGQRFNLKELDLLDAYEERKNIFKDRGFIELYLIALRRYQTVLAEMIIDISKYFPAEKKIIKSLQAKFFLSWIKEVQYEPIGLDYKLKYILFMISKRLYVYMKGRKK